MRKVVFGGANSLDGYFARPDDTVDWLLWDDELGRFMADNWKTYDAVVMGRRTYEVAARSGTGAYPGVASYVCSRTLASASKGVELVADAAELVGRLKQQPGKDICVMGGGVLAQSLFEADLIDEIGCNVHPVLLGAGIPLFHAMKRQIDLELLHCKTFQNGCVLVQYRVRR